MKPGDILNGFKLVYSQPMPELKATLHRFTYWKNGADVVWLERDDENKTFGIAFRTVPQDHTGIFHILEHSVLNGSEKYPLREPFVNLLKSSLATFINAFTFPDKTMYPFSSRNDKDFLNLMDVYMDAVLHPLSLKDPHSFRQEGWHYELENPDGELTINGVVFNEMKGAYTSPDSLIRDYLDRQLFPDTCYGKDSGGDPDHIPELTYEDYKANHHRFYHPSNSYIWLDGSIDTDAVFAKLDSFLKEYDRINPDSDIAVQAPITPAEATEYYAVGPEDDGNNKAIMGMGWVYGTYADTLKNMAVGALTEVLAGSNDAPLTSALLEAGLCEDVSLERSDSTKQMYVDLILKNCDPAKKDEIRTLVYDTLRKQAEEGIDRKRLTGVLSRMEFVNREKDFGRFPRGLAYGIESLTTWLYGGDPADALSLDGLFVPLAEMAENGGFEQLIREVFLDSRHHGDVIMLPSATIAEEKREAEKKRLADIKAGWTAEQVQQVIDEFHALRERQNREDTPEQLAMMPRLTLEDLPEKRSRVPATVTAVDGTTLLYQDMDAAGISYLTLYFSLADMPAEELSKISILAHLVGDVATENYDVAALHAETNEKLGRLNIYPQIHAGWNKAETFVTVNVAVLENRKQDAVRLLDEVLNRSVFTDEAYILNLVRQDRINTEQGIMMRGNAYAARHAAAALSPAGAMNEALQGIAFTRVLQKMEKEFGADTLAWMDMMRKRIFTRDRVTVSLTGEMDEAWVKAVLAVLPAGEKGETAVYTPAERRADGFSIPSEIGFAARAAVLKPENNGAALVAANFLTLDYLWNTIRVKGGAYGTGFRVSETGNMEITSFRDPNAAQSLDSFCETARVLREFCDGDADLTQYIISTTGSIDPLRTPRSVGDEAAWMYFTGYTEEDRTREWNQVLHTTKDDLRKLSDVIGKACDESVVCVIGGKTAMDACGSRLEHIESVQ